MKNRIFYLIVFWLLLMLVTKQVNAAENIPFELFAKQQTIRVGDPLIVDVILVIPESVAVNPDQKIDESLDYGMEFFYIEREGTLIRKSPSLFQVFELESSPKLRYRATAILFYDWGKNDIIFDSAGEYSVRFGESSAALKVKVEEPSAANKLALSLIYDRDEYGYLLMGSNLSEEQEQKFLPRLSEIVERCDGTFLAKMAAARLGLVYFSRHSQKHRSLTTFRSLYKKGNMDEPLFDKACEYLAIASKLPDEMPLREKVIYTLSMTEAELKVPGTN